MHCPDLSSTPEVLKITPTRKGTSLRLYLPLPLQRCTTHYSLSTTPRDNLAADPTSAKEPILTLSQSHKSTENIQRTGKPHSAFDLYYDSSWTTALSV